MEPSALNVNRVTSCPAGMVTEPWNLSQRPSQPSLFGAFTVVDFSPIRLLFRLAILVMVTGCSWPGTPTRIWIFSLELMLPLRCA